MPEWKKMKHGYMKTASNKSSSTVHTIELGSKSSSNVARVPFRFVKKIGKDHVLPEVAWAYARFALNIS
jgi:hypothetical protein